MTNILNKLNTLINNLTTLQKYIEINYRHILKLDYINITIMQTVVGYRTGDTLQASNDILIKDIQVTTNTETMKSFIFKQPF